MLDVKHQLWMRTYVTYLLIDNYERVTFEGSWCLFFGLFGSQKDPRAKALFE